MCIFLYKVFQCYLLKQSQNLKPQEINTEIWLGCWPAIVLYSLLFECYESSRMLIFRLSRQYFSNETLGFTLNYYSVITRPVWEKKLGTLTVSLLCSVPLEMGGNLQTQALPYAHEVSKVVISFPLSKTYSIQLPSNFC